MYILARFLLWKNVQWGSKNQTSEYRIHLRTKHFGGWFIPFKDLTNCLVFECHLKTRTIWEPSYFRPFENRTCPPCTPFEILTEINHLNTEHNWYSDSTVLYWLSDSWLDHSNTKYYMSAPNPWFRSTAITSTISGEHNNFAASRRVRSSCRWGP